MVEKIREVYERYGFEPVETPAMEFTDALGKFLPDQDRPNEGVFSFQDDDEQWISLRYDLTAPLARYVAENFDALPKPYRSYRVGYVYRNEKPGPGRFRQFMQFDADTVGSASPAADAEMCMMAADTMEALGIPRGSYVVKVNNRKVLDGVMESDRAWWRRECGAHGSRCCGRSTSWISLSARKCASCSAQGEGMAVKKARAILQRRRTRTCESRAVCSGIRVQAIVARNSATIWMKEVIVAEILRLCGQSIEGPEQTGVEELERTIQIASLVDCVRL